MIKQLFSIVFLIFVFVLAGTFSNLNAQTISGSVGAATRGAAARGSVVMNIPGGLHVNSNRPNSEYAIPTRVSLTANGAKGVSVSYPRGRNRKFGFSDDALNVYEGRAVFPFTVKIPANFKGDTLKVRAVVKFQACTEEVCYAPKTQEITLTAKVR